MDVLDYAVNMELDGEKYYREQAAKNGENPLNTVFNALADEEANHAEIIKEKARGQAYRAGEIAPMESRHVFDGLVDFQMDVKENPDQLDAYRMAMDKEKQSIELYRKMSDEAGDDDGLFKFLIGQEQEHYRILEQIVELVKRPTEWVESAEFGNRKEY